MQNDQWTVKVQKMRNITVIDNRMIVIPYADNITNKSSSRLNVSLIYRFIHLRETKSRKIIHSGKQALEQYEH